MTGIAKYYWEFIYLIMQSHKRPRGEPGIFLTMPSFPFSYPLFCSYVGSPPILPPCILVLT